MMLVWLITLYIVAVFDVSAARTGSKLPSWIKPCYRDDPNFDECATVTGQSLIPLVVKGDRRIRLPSMDPLEIVEIKLDKSVTHLGMDITLRNVSITGLKETIVKRLHGGFQEQYYSLDLFVPKLEIICSYNVSGRILVLPITGAGPGNITIKNVHARFLLSFNLETNPKDGKDYMTIKDYSLDFNTTRAHIKLENLFNGDKLLGDTMNQFMNDNWRELVNNIGPVISAALSDLLIQIFNVIGKVIPYDDIVPPTANIQE